MGECEIEIEKTERGLFEVTLFESGARAGNGIIRREYAIISSQVYAKFLRGIPVEKIHWAYHTQSIGLATAEPSKVSLIWDGERFFSPKAEASRADTALFAMS